MIANLIFLFFLPSIWKERKKEDTMLTGKCLPKSIFFRQILLKWLFLILMLNRAELTQKSPPLNDCNSGASSNGHAADSAEDAQRSNFSNEQKLHRMCTGRTTDLGIALQRKPTRKKCCSLKCRSYQAAYAPIIK